MFNDNAFPNAGSITGSGGAQITGSGVFLYLDYGQNLSYSVAPYFVYQTGILRSLQDVVQNSITGSGGAQITGSGVFLYLDYFQHNPNGILIQTEQEASGSSSAVIVYKPYAFYFRRK